MILSNQKWLWLLGVAALLAAIGGASLADQADPPRETSGATLVTLHLDKVDAAEAWTKLLATMNEPPLFQNQLYTRVLPNQRVTIHADRQPYMQVYANLSDQALAGLSMRGALPGRIMQQLAVPAGQRLVRGPFLFIPESMRYVGGISLAPNRATTHDQMYLMVWCANEPKTIVVARHYQVIEAVDDQGNSLTDKDVDALNKWLPISNQPCDYAVALHYPLENTGKVLTHFRAIATSRIQTATSPVEIDDVLHAEPRAIAIAKESTRFLAVREDGGNYEVSFAVADGADNVPSQAVLCQLDRAVRLYDADGKELSRLTTHLTPLPKESKAYFDFATRQNDDQPTGPPAKLKLDITSATRDVDESIEFKDLRMDFVR